MLVEAGQQVTELPVWHGDEATVKVTTKQRFDIVTPRSGRRKMVATVTYENPVLAPIKTGEQPAKLRVTLPGLIPQEVDLVAAEDIEGNIIGRAMTACFI